MPKLEIYLPDGTRTSRDLIEEKVTIGRLADNAIQIDEGSVSSHHAELTLEHGEYHLHDLGSTNGTYVNDEQVTDAVLRQGDQIRFGKVETVYTQEAVGEGSAPPPEVPQPVEVQPGESSHRPVDFKNSSPFAKIAPKHDPVSIGVYALAFLSVLAAGYAVMQTLSMAMPG